MDDRIFKALRQIRDTRSTVVVKKEDVDHLMNEGWADEADGHLFLTEAGGEALDFEIIRRKGGIDPDERAKRRWLLLTLAELDAAIVAHPEAKAILLDHTDWPLIESEAALPRRQDHPTESGYIYRGLRVLFTSPGPSRLSRREV